MLMKNDAADTMPRSKKGALGPAPRLEGALGEVAAAVAQWPNVVSTVHWDLFDPTRVDGADFYAGDEELGHIHLDGDLHLATNAELGKDMIEEGVARKFPYARGWVHADIHSVGADAAITLFRRNYDRLGTAKNGVRSDT